MTSASGEGYVFTLFVCYQDCGNTQQIFTSQILVVIRSHYVSVKVMVRLLLSFCIIHITSVIVK